MLFAVSIFFIRLRCQQSDLLCPPKQFLKMIHSTIFWSVTGYGGCGYEKPILMEMGNERQSSIFILASDFDFSFTVLMKMYVSFYPVLVV